MPVVGLNDYVGDKKKAKKEEEDESKRNELYTGGNRRGGGGSGLSVIGPSSDDSEDDEEELKGDVGKMFSRAQQHKDEVSAPKRVVTMYKNGFTVDDGEFRSLHDPANLPFLRDVAEGLVPRELEESADSGAFHLELVDRRGEEWQPPSFTAFGGAGQTLGTTATTASAPPPVAAVPAAPVEAPLLQVDASQPTTTLQIRLSSGQRLKETLNLTHTVADLEALVRNRAPTDRAFALLAGYPPKALADKTLSLKEAGLDNAAVSQKFT